MSETKSRSKEQKQRAEAKSRSKEQKQRAEAKSRSKEQKQREGDDRRVSEYRVSGSRGVHGPAGIYREVQEVVDAGRGQPGRLHDLPRQQRRQRRDPDHPAQPAPVGGGAGVGRQQLPAHAGRAAAWGGGGGGGG